MQHLAKDLLDRHGIRRQVSSALIVKSANEILVEILPMPAKQDVRAISFVEGALKIGVRHPAAAHASAQVFEELENRLSKQYPDVHVKKIHSLVQPSIFDHLI